MSPDQEPRNGDSPDSGLFGKLPQSRPGVRSPRREEGKRAASARSAAARKRDTSRAQAGAKPKAKRPATARRAAPKAPADDPVVREPLAPEPTATQPPSTDVPPDERRGGLDDLAWAGVAVAAEAATAGLRIVNRALDAMREAVERR